jgi:hypothetical protein
LELPFPKKRGINTGFPNWTTLQVIGALATSRAQASVIYFEWALGFVKRLEKKAGNKN